MTNEQQPADQGRGVGELPCAFCGSAPGYHTHGGVWRQHHVFYCPTVDCPAHRNVRDAPSASCGEGYSYPTKDEALAAWNKRDAAIAALTQPKGIDWQPSADTVRRVMRALTRLGHSTPEAPEVVAIQIDQWLMTLCRELDSFMDSLPRQSEAGPTSTDLAMLLVARCLDTNARSFECRLDGVTDDSKEAGDWIVTVSNCDAMRPVAEVVANRPSGYSAGHRIKWLTESVLEPGTKLYTTPQPAQADTTAGEHGVEEKWCLTCEGRGAISTGIDEWPTSLCKRCNGTGYDPAQAASAPGGDHG